MKNHPADAGGISVSSKLRLPIRLIVGLEFAFHWLTPIENEFDVIRGRQINLPQKIHKRRNLCLTPAPTKRSRLKESNNFFAEKLLTICQISAILKSETNYSAIHYIYVIIKKIGSQKLKRLLTLKYIQL